MPIRLGGAAISLAGFAALSLTCAWAAPGEDGTPQPTAPPQPPASASTCPTQLQGREVLRDVDRISRTLDAQAAPMSAAQALTLVRREVVASLRLNLPARDYGALQGRGAALDRAMITGCWPRLASALARSDPPAPGVTTELDATPSAPVVDNAYEQGRRRQAERYRRNEEDKRRREAQLKAQADTSDAFVTAQAEERRQRDAEARQLERDERARQEALAQRRRDDDERERQAEFAAEQERSDAAIAAEKRRREAAALQAEARQRQQAELLRQQQETLAKARADAEAQYHAAEQARQLSQEADRVAAERAQAEQAAERLKRPECREADRVAAEQPELQSEKAFASLATLAIKLRAGMQVEACAVARKTFTSAERVRSAAARCDPLEAIPYNDLASGLRSFILEQGC